MDDRITSTERSSIIAAMIAHQEIFKLVNTHSEDVGKFIKRVTKQLNRDYDEENDAEPPKKLVAGAYDQGRLAITLAHKVLSICIAHYGRMPANREEFFYIANGQFQALLAAPRKAHREKSEHEFNTMIALPYAEISDGVNMYFHQLENNAVPSTYHVKQTVSKYFMEWYYTIQQQRSAYSPAANEHFLGELRKQLVSIRAYSGVKRREPFPDGYFPPPPKDALTSSGIDWVDNLLGGGLCKGEVVAHSATINSGKTTLVTQLAWRRARSVISRIYANHYKHSHGPYTLEIENEILARPDLPIVYVIVYEAVETLLPNLVSFAARVPRGTALTASVQPVENSPLARDHHKSYESDPVKVGDGTVPWEKLPEFHRVQRVAQICNRMIHIVDFSRAASTAYSSLEEAAEREALAVMSAKGVDGIAEYIAQDQVQIGEPGIDIVILDHLTAALDSMSSGRKIDRWQEVREFPQELQNKVAKSLQVPVWLCHQLSNKENTKAAGKIQSGMSAEGGAGFWTYVASGFSSGLLNKDNVTAFRCEKVRRGNKNDIPVEICKLDDHLAQWLPDDRYALSNGRLELKEDIYNRDNRGRARR